MWIALSILAIYAWLFKRKRKTVRQQVPKGMLTVLIVFEAMGISMAQDKELIIQGEILTSVQSKGKIMVFLVDETNFNIPLSGVDTLVLEPTERTIHFEFNARETGIYGIRCIHDLNSNGKLDKGIFGPVEPYGFSWKAGKRFPFEFSDISFTAYSDTFIRIKMEN